MVLYSSYHCVVTTPGVTTTKLLPLRTIKSADQTYKELMEIKRKSLNQTMSFKLMSIYHPKGNQGWWFHFSISYYFSVDIDARLYHACSFTCFRLVIYIYR